MLKDTEFFDDIQAEAEKRRREAEGDMLRTMLFLQQGDPLNAETKAQRKFAAKSRSENSIRDDIPRSIPPGAEAAQGERDNFLPVSFLAMGTSVSRAVARIKVQSTGNVGTGFLCAPNLLITNKHVLPNLGAAQSALAEFDFVAGDHIDPSVYKLDPARCYISDDVLGLDYAIVAIGSRVDGSEDLPAFGYCPLSAADNKHAVGEFANVIQHPEGREKQVVLQDNLIVSRGESERAEHNVLHYVADTLPGSSGAPVFNNFWQVIALHHWGEATQNIPSLPTFDPKSVNQGVRISRIVKQLSDKVGGFAGTERSMISQLLTLGETVQPRDVMGASEAHRCAPVMITPKPPRPGAAQAAAAMNFTVPLEITVSIGGAQPAVTLGGAGISVNPDAPLETKSEISSGAEARLPKIGEGYRADFLDLHIVPLPRLRAAHADDVQPLLHPDRHPAAKPGELQFTHFSTVMHRTRKLPIFGACNVDGKTLFGIKSNKSIYGYSDTDVQIFKASAAEGGHSWRPDARIAKDDQVTENWYTRKNDLVPRPGTDDADIYKSVADFDRGHIVRRTEPIWGPPDKGRAANYQTFTHVNAAPQTKKFNQSKARDDVSISSGEEKRSWYGMEVAVLRAATNDDKKMNVFTGPIFQESDPIYAPGKPGHANCQVPLDFWKVVVWEDGEDLKALAMRYSQKWSLLRQTGAEALDDASELYLLRDFLTTIDDIENETGILFGRKVGNADILKDISPADLAAMTLQDFAQVSGGALTS